MSNKERIEGIDYVDITPTWSSAAYMLCAALRCGDYKGQEMAQSEVMRMGRILDHVKEHYPEALTIDDDDDTRGLLTPAQRKQVQD